MLEFSRLGLLSNILIFVAAAIAVWISGAKITRYANVISEKTGLSQALIGMLLLGGVTSLPELAVAVSSAASGASAMAVNSILGGVAMQVAVLAVADMLIGRRALTSVVPDPVVFLQGALKIMLLSLVAAAILVGDRPVLGIGLWMWLLLMLVGVSLWILSKARDRHAWEASGNGSDARKEKERARSLAERDRDKSLRWALVCVALAGSTIVVAGFLLSRTGDALAELTGLGESFVGAVFLAVATSLPEISTVFTAVRAGLYTMAVSDIFGTNLFDVSFLFAIDAVDGGDAALQNAGRFSAFAAVIGITVTAIFMAGLAERRDRTILRMGWDSASVLLVYLGGLVVLYFLRDGS